MNNVRQTAKINEQELQLALQGGGSWHDEYKDSAYIFIGGLPRELTEGDVITIFSQYGEVLDVNLPRDKATGKKRGFGFLMYEDQRSTVLAVDNLNGSKVLDRTLRVDHVKEYKQPGERDEEGNYQPPEQPSFNAKPEAVDPDAPRGGAAAASADEDSELDLEDPMAEYISRQKKEGKDRSSDERAAKAQRKEDRRRIREERERRKAAKASGRHGSATVDNEDRDAGRDRKSSERRDARADASRRGDDGRDSERDRDRQRDRARGHEGRESERGSERRHRDEDGPSHHRSDERRGERYDDRGGRTGHRDYDRDRASPSFRRYGSRDFSPGRRDHRSGRDDRYDRERDRYGGR